MIKIKFNVYYQRLRQPVIAISALIFLCWISPAISKDTLIGTLRIQVANSVLETGMFLELTRQFKLANPSITMDIKRGGSLQVLDHGKNGLADIIITHHPTGEDQFITQGYGLYKSNIMYNEYAIVGPSKDPLKLAEKKDIMEVLHLLAEEEVRFLIASPYAGAYQKFEELWAIAGINPNWIDYENTGVSAKSSLLQAAQYDAYTFVDMATYFTNRDTIGNTTVPLYRDNTLLRNIYSVIVINPEKIPGANLKLAEIFYQYLVSDEAQDLISRYGIETTGVYIYYPAAHLDKDLRHIKISTKHKEEQKFLIWINSLVLCVTLLLVVILIISRKIYRTVLLNSEIEHKVKISEAEKELALVSTIEKSRFLANMSHELRTPLNAIIGYSELLEEDAAASENTDLTNDLTKIISSSHHLLSLINNILDLSKIEANKVILNPEKIKVGRLALGIIDVIRPLANANNNKLSYYSSIDDLEICVDILRLKQVLVNILGNACKFSREGNIALSIYCDKSTPNTGIFFTVSDDGIGISPHKLDTIFQPYDQAEVTTTRDHGGTGLGLAISKQLVDLMGGKISVESTLGEGTRMTVCIIQQTAIDVENSEQIAVYG